MWEEHNGNTCHVYYLVYQRLLIIENVSVYYSSIQYGLEVNSFEYREFRRAVSCTFPPSLYIMFFKTLEQDFITDNFTSYAFLATN